MEDDNPVRSDWACVGQVEIMENRTAKESTTILAGKEIAAIVTEIVTGAEDRSTPLRASYALVVGAWNVLKLCEGAGPVFAKLLRDLEDEVDGVAP